MSFYQLLQKYNSDDKSFEYICKLFGDKCDLSKCKKIKRHFDRNNHNYKSKDFNLLKYFLDIIHSHYQHGYHLYRLTKKEQSKLKDVFDEKNDAELVSNSLINKKIVTLRNILKQKKEIFNQAMNEEK